MASFWDFSRANTPSPTMEEISSRFFDTLREQTGEGVVTRRQSKIQALSAENDNSSLAEPSDHNDRLSHASSEPVQVQPDSPVHSPMSVKSSTEELSDPSDAPYLNETLVAENADLKAYILKTYFKRMKNFV